MTRKSFVGGAIILMLAGFVVRILGFIYRIYLSNLIGAEGMGLFQLISPVYSLIILTLTSGVSIAVSKLVAEELAKNHRINLKRITACALGAVVTAGLIVSVVLYFNLQFVVNVILKDSRTYYSMLFLIPCIPVIAAASAIKGYFYGTQDVTPTAWSQIVEQVVRIGLVMGMAGYFVGAGLEYACALATIGMAIGEISNLAVVFIVYRFRRNVKMASRTGIKRKRLIIRDIVSISIPISFNRLISSIMFAVEQILIPQRLGAGGLDYQSSIEEFGRLAGMAMPLIWFPSLVTNSLATTLVPAISEATSLKNFRTANYRISKSIQITFILGFIFTAIFLSYPHEIGDMLYRREKIGNMLFLLGFTCVFFYLQGTLLGVLNGLGKQGISLRNSLIGSVIRINFVYFVMPTYGITGYIWGIIGSSALVCVLNLSTVVKTTGMPIHLRNWIVKPGGVGLVMFLIGRYIYSFFGIFRLGNTWTIMITITANVVIALFLMTLVGVLQKEELLKMTGLYKVVGRKRR
jgi:stage V sporulation protein B